MKVKLCVLLLLFSSFGCTNKKIPGSLIISSGGIKKGSYHNLYSFKDNEFISLDFTNTSDLIYDEISKMFYTLRFDKDSAKSYIDIWSNSKENISQAIEINGYVKRIQRVGSNFIICKPKSLYKLNISTNNQELLYNSDKEIVSFVYLENDRKIILEEFGGFSGDNKLIAYNLDDKASDLIHDSVSKVSFSIENDTIIFLDNKNSSIYLYDLLSNSIKDTDMTIKNVKLITLIDKNHFIVIREVFKTINNMEFVKNRFNDFHSLTLYDTDEKKRFNLFTKKMYFFDSIQYVDKAYTSILLQE